MSTSPTLEDNIRLILGASGTNAALLTGLEIDHALTLYPSWRLGAAFLAEMLAARALNDPMSFHLSGVLIVSWADRAKTWMSIAKQLRSEEQRAIDMAAAPMGMTTILLEREEASYDPTEYRYTGRYSRRVF